MSADNVLWRCQDCGCYPYRLNRIFRKYHPYITAYLCDKCKTKEDKKKSASEVEK